MENTATISSALTVQGRPLSETIARFRAEFATMKNELRDIQRENTALKQEIAKWQSRSRIIPETDLSALRRHVAYYCHPDRGGDANLMSRLNTLFDSLAAFEDTKRQCLYDNDGGTVQ